MAAIDDTIENLRSSLGLTSAQAEDVARSLSNLNTATTRNVFATDAERKATEQLTNNLIRLKSAGTGVSNAFSTTVSGMSNLSTAVSGSGAAFTAVIPILNTMQSVIGTMIASFKSLSGGLAGLVPFFGTALKGVSDVVAIGIGKSVDVIFGAAIAQVSATQNLANSFLTLSNSGMIFGGSLLTAQKQAKEAGMSLETFASFATKNAAALALLSGNAQTSAINVARISRDLGPGLVSLYGGFENLGSAVADYMAMQTMVGKDAVRDQEALTQGAKAYLLNQKELSNLTGKDITRLKQEQEARLKTAAYQAKLGEMGPLAAQRTQNAVSQIIAKYGDQAGQLAMESVARGGDIISEGGLKFQAMMPELANAITQVLDATKLSDDDYKQRQAEIFASTADIVKNYQVQFKDYLELFAGGRGPSDLFKMLNDTIAAGIASQSAQRNAVKAQEDASESTKTALEKLPDIMDTAIVSLEDFKIKMNDLTIKYLPTTAIALEAAYTAADLFAESLNKLADVTDFLVGKMSAAELAKRLGLAENEVPPPTGPARPGPFGPLQLPPGFPSGAPPTAPPTAPPVVPQPPPQSSNEAPTPVADARRRENEDRQEQQAILQTEIENLTKAILAMANPTNTQPGNEAQTAVMASMLAELRDHSSKLDRIRDALA